MYNIFLFPYFFVLVFKHDFFTCVDFTRISASNTASDMTSQIRSHIEYLKQTYYILLLSVVALMTVFNTI